MHRPRLDTHCILKSLPLGERQMLLPSSTSCSINLRLNTLFGISCHLAVLTGQILHCKGWKREEISSNSYWLPLMLYWMLLCYQENNRSLQLHWVTSLPVSVCSHNTLQFGWYNDKLSIYLLKRNQISWQSTQQWFEISPVIDWWDRGSSWPQWGSAVLKMNE